MVETIFCSVYLVQSGEEDATILRDFSYKVSNSFRHHLLLFKKKIHYLELEWSYLPSWQLCNDPSSSMVYTDGSEIFSWQYSSNCSTNDPITKTHSLI